MRGILSRSFLFCFVYRYIPSQKCDEESISNTS